MEIDAEPTQTRALACHTTQTRTRAVLSAPIAAVAAVASVASVAALASVALFPARQGLTHARTDAPQET
jgi:hypothetical protein